MTKKTNPAVSEYYRKLGQASAKAREKRILEAAKQAKVGGDKSLVDERAKRG